MATIQNERDVLLQAAPVRFIPPPLPQEIQDAVNAVKGIEILSDGTVFKVTAGTPTPSSITLTIKFSLISGTVTWSVVQGTATLTGTGNTRTLTAANMSTDRVRIRASITVDSVTYMDEIDIARVSDGAAGDDGADGDAVDIVFRRSPVQPATPSPSAGTPSGWYSDVDQVPPASAPMWSSVGTKAGGATNYTWQVPLKVEGSDGEAGLSVAEVTIYRRATATPPTPSGGSFNFGTQTLTAPFNWWPSVPTGSDPVYISKAVVSVQGITGVVPITGWTVPVLAMQNGTPGNDGAPGIRGTVHISASRSPATWNDTAANNAILAYTGASTRVTGDEVTLYNTTAGWAETRYWTGSVWQFQTQVIDGNLIVTGTLEFGKLRGGEATFANFSGRVAIGEGNSGVRITRDTPGNYNQSCLFINDYHNGTADVWAAHIMTMQRPRALGIQSFTGGSNWNINYPVVSVRASLSSGTGSYAVNALFTSQGASTITILAQNTGAATRLDIATQTHAAYATNGTYGPFTGSHEGAINPTDLAGQGDIVIDAEILQATSLTDTFHLVSRSSTANQKGAVGVLTRRGDFGSHIPASYRWPDTQDGDETIEQYDPALDDIKASYEYVVFAAVGEGQINVCGQNGNISKGDLIVCSDIPGKGMRQSDDIVRSYTVAKARADVTFDNPDDVKLVPCIYLCG